MKTLTRKQLQERNNHLIQLFQELGSTRLVSDRTGINMRTLHSVLQKHGVATPRTGRRHNPYSACDMNADLVLKMNNEGCSLSEMAQAVGTKGAEVKKFLLRQGITREFPTTKIGEKHYAWKGRLIDKDGYILIHHKGHPNARKHTPYIFEHRLVMEEMIGRYLLPTEVVHHKDGNKQNNHPSNLQLFASNGEHLAVDLAGRCPKWSPEGFERICKSNRRNGLLKRKTNRKE